VCTLCLLWLSGPPGTQRPAVYRDGDSVILRKEIFP
jgi:hypothetical protein